jgi:hypothetical protein
MKRLSHDDAQIARFATDTIVLILFMVLLNVVLSFGILLYFLCWLVGLA